MYLSLYAILMSGIMVSLYTLIGASSRNHTKALVEEEGSFLIGKIDFVLSRAASISMPSSSASGNTLRITSYDTTLGNPISTAVDASGDMSLTRGGTSRTLNSEVMRVICPVSGCFTHESASGDGINPERVSVTFTAEATTSDGMLYRQDFSTVKYLRK